MPEPSLLSDIMHSRMETRRCFPQIAGDFGLTPTKLLRKIADSKAIDIGCGSGELIYHCEANGVAIDGIDVCPPPLTFQLGTFHQLTFDEMGNRLPKKYEFGVCSRSLGTYAYNSREVVTHFCQLDKMVNGVVLMTLECPYDPSLELFEDEELLNQIEAFTVWRPDRTASFEADTVSIIRLFTSFSITSAHHIASQPNANWTLIGVVLDNKRG